MNRIVVFLFSCVLFSSVARGQVQPEVFTLDNGMKFILLPRFEEPNSVAAGWVAKVGSVNERPGITGISHFFEHLMFKGTKTIGTSDAVADAAFTDSERIIRNRMLDIIWGEQYARFKNGEIDDPWDEAYDTPELAGLRSDLLVAMEEHRSVIIKDEFASIYQGEGAVGLNAFTSEDVTFYINQLPANKLELWCWMESDRLSDSVFREFFSERDVVHEERRMRTESSPTGEFDEQFNSMFWQASPYSWPVIGWPSDLNSYTLEGARRYFDIYYRPNNLIGVLVGDFDVEVARTLIKTYFGRLERGSVLPPPVPTIEPSQKAPQRMVADVDAQSRVEIRYHAVPVGHKDGYAFEILEAVLNGRTGRLYKSMVEGAEIAASVNARTDQKKYAGAFSFIATIKGDATPDDLESAWYEQVSLLQTEPVSKQELEKVKNNVIADQYRRLQSNFFLMIQLGYMEALGRWEYINEYGVALIGVTVDDIMQIANQYLIPNNSSVAIYYRSEDAPPIDEELAAFSPQQQSQIRAMLAPLENLPHDELVQALVEMKSNASQIPAEFKPMFDYMLKELQDRVDSMAGESISEDAPEGNGIDGEGAAGGGVGEKEETALPEIVELTPQQQSEVDLFIASIADKPLNELRMVYAALQSVAPGIAESERLVFDLMITKLGLHIAELEE